MLHRSYMRRGVSLEVIVEEDDHAEVSLDPIPFEDDLDCSPPSSTSSTSADTEAERERINESKRERKTKKRERRNSLKLRDGKEKRKRQKERKEEDERWRLLERQRSLSCETLTILDVGHDDLSREQWEEEAREWDVDDGDGSEREVIQHCISRRKILEEASRRHYEYGENCENGEYRDQTPDYRDQLPRHMENRGSPDGSDGEAEVSDACVCNSDIDADIPEDFVSGNSGDFCAYRVKVENRIETDSLEGLEEDSKFSMENIEGLEGDSKFSMENIYEDVGITDTRSELAQLDTQSKLALADTQSKLAQPDTQSKLALADTESELALEQLKSKSNAGSANITNGYSTLPTFFQKELWLQDVEDAWITVGDLENGVLENGVLENGLQEKEELTKQEEDKEPKTTDKEYVKLNSEEPNVLESENETDRDEVASVQSDITVTIEESVGAETEHENAPPNGLSPDNILSVKNRKDFFENKQTCQRTCSPLADRLLTALATPEVLIIERSSSPQEEITQNSWDEENSTEAPPYNVHNMELRPEELPPPNTVSSVRQIFEIIPTAPPASTLFDIPCRFDHVRSNPTSKILRFDRDRRTQTTATIDDDFAAQQTEDWRQSSTINNCAEWRQSSTINNYADWRQSSKSTESSSSTSSIASTSSLINSENYAKNLTNTSITSRNSSINSENCSINSTNSTITSTNTITVSTNSPTPSTNFSTLSTGVNLRKPKVVSKFDVRKALRENPRYFHIRLEREETKDNGEGKRDPAKDKKGSSRTPIGRRNTITYSYLEAKHQKQRGTATTLRWTRQTIDRLDEESMSSDSSEDSGVSRDFSSSILSSFCSSKKKKGGNSMWHSPQFIKKEYASDPSFKWIEPSVLSKIRSMGTTVIYFGPRRRPQPGIHSRYTKRASPQKSAKEATTEKPAITVTDLHDDATLNETMDESHTHPLQRPGSVSDYAQTQMSLLKKEQRRKSTGNNSVIYDFTQKQAADGIY